MMTQVTNRAILNINMLNPYSTDLPLIASNANQQDYW